ncbi:MULTISPECIES: hypothetical protein [unclassified Serratia (in: enterobacteria)]|uniref:hypothetical protein n=1 Tax=unclassified Serratia (in: enterobacteria) TaxID=2647522 RepID=UPI000467F028|nr:MULTISPECIES: hypothetical protein [unclassified Serratia (in: enterobacteria)]
MRDINKSDNRIFRPIAGIAGPNQSAAANQVGLKLISNRKDKHLSMLADLLSDCPTAAINVSLHFRH